MGICGAELEAVALTPGPSPASGRGVNSKDACLLFSCLPSSLLAPGDYTLELETAPRSGKPTPVASFRFRVRQG